MQHVSCLLELQHGSIHKGIPRSPLRPALKLGQVLLPSPQSRIRASEKVVVVLAAPLGGHLVAARHGAAAHGPIEVEEAVPPGKVHNEPVEVSPEQGVDEPPHALAAVAFLKALDLPVQQPRRDAPEGQVRRELGGLVSRRAALAPCRPVGSAHVLLQPSPLPNVLLYPSQSEALAASPGHRRPLAVGNERLVEAQIRQTRQGAPLDARSRRLRQLEVALWQLPLRVDRTNLACRDVPLEIPERQIGSDPALRRFATRLEVINVVQCVAPAPHHLPSSTSDFPQRHFHLRL
mmetsp:Transcript_92997/g.221106  ORF Transcript_92997/g.221106 Transcript_92997/m.221106 type:complete len:291 (-) Transcript_92997:294-1166(-)